MISFEFEVLGQPRPQGSKRGIPFRRKDGGLGQRMIDDNPHVKAWRQEIAAVARKAFEQAYPGTPMLQGAVALAICFYRPRPKGHFGKKGVKATAPAHPTTKPDTIKLARAVEDALTGTVWRDDSQVVKHSLRKEFGDHFLTIVKVQELVV